MRSNKLKLIFFSVVSLVLVASCRPKGNRLAGSLSPYLREHADNPVDWFEWSNEALQKAKEEDKPLLISIGYSSCHWCHVMEAESFMDTAVARVMNEHFVCIKVDREERPDIDNIYSNACQLISGSSGWPLNAFALPDGKPFFAGTYYSKESWINLLKNVASAYKQKRQTVLLQANSLTQKIVDLEPASFDSLASSTPFDKRFCESLFDSVYQQLDLRDGGLQGIPKFPMPPLLEFLMQYGAITNNEKALNAVSNSLTKMALGGIYDQVGGGFARYALDSNWHIPHFEKMLADNAQLMSVYAHAYQLTGEVPFKKIVEDIAVFVERDMSGADGRFYGSLNSETAAGEGMYYAWTQAQLRAGPEQFTNELLEYYQVSEEGNWKKGWNILHATETIDSFCKRKNIDAAAFATAIVQLKKNLLGQRNKREQPTRDEKCITSWNALMLTGFLDAYAALGNKTYLDKALSNARFIENNLLQKDGQLSRGLINGRALGPAFLDDYALLARAYIRLYQLTFDIHWLGRARDITASAVQQFFDPKTAMFFYSAAGADGLVARKITVVDDVMPSPNAAMAEVLYLLSVYFENDEQLSKSRAMISKMKSQMLAETPYYAEWSSLATRFAFGSFEIAIAGKDAVERNLMLQKSYLPQGIFMGTTGREDLPLLINKFPPKNTLIYVCMNRVCKLPVETAEQALQQVRSFGGR